MSLNVPLTEHMDIVLMKEASRAEGSDAKNGDFSTDPIHSIRYRNSKCLRATNSLIPWLKQELSTG